MNRKTASRILTTLILSVSIFGAVFAQDEAGAVFDTRQRTERNRDENSNNTYMIRRPRGMFVLPDLPKESWALLKPTQEEFAAHKETLSSAKANLAKAFPDADCEKFVVNLADEKCFRYSRTFGIGSYYSLRKKVNVRSGWSDLYFSKGEIYAINYPASLGFFTELGNIPLNEIREDSPIVSNIWKFQIPKTRSQLAGIRRI